MQLSTTKYMIFQRLIAEENSCQPQSNLEKIKFYFLYT